MLYPPIAERQLVQLNANRWSTMQVARTPLVEEQRPSNPAKRDERADPALLAKSSVLPNGQLPPDGPLVRAGQKLIGSSIFEGEEDGAKLLAKNPYTTAVVSDEPLARKPARSSVQGVDERVADAREALRDLLRFSVKDIIGVLREAGIVKESARGGPALLIEALADTSSPPISSIFDERIGARNEIISAWQRWEQARTALALASPDDRNRLRAELGGLAKQLGVAESSVPAIEVPQSVPFQPGKRQGGSYQDTSFSGSQAA